MAYKAAGKWVTVQKNGRWVLHRKQPTASAAQALAQQLNAAMGKKPNAK